MSLLFVDSFDHYATADIGTKWPGSVTSASGMTIAIGATGQNGNGARFSWAGVNADIHLSRGFSPSGTTLIIGFAFNPSASNLVATQSARTVLLSVLDAGVAQCCLRYNADGTISFARGQSTVLGTAGPVLPSGAFTYIELKVLLSTTVGTYEVRFNGTTVLSGTGANTAGTGTTTWSSIRFGCPITNNQENMLGGTYDIDNFYCCDGSGSVNNDFLGPLTIKAVFPDGAGATSQMTPSTGANNTCVDETTPNGDTDYVSETTVGDLDTYTYAALGITGTVKGVQTNIYAKSVGSGGEVIAPMFRISSTNYAGANGGGQTTSYQYQCQVQETSPATSSAWTVSEIDGAEFGQKLVS